METTIVALIVVTLILFGMLGLVQAYFSSQDQVLEASRAMEERVGEQVRTSLLPVGATSDGDVVDVTVRNDGGAKLADLPRWDVVVEYGPVGAQVARWYPYVQAAEPGLNQWTVQGIYLDAAQAVAEVFEPGILNPGEEMIVRVRVSPPVPEGTTNLVTIGTPNGISATAVFTR